MKNVVIIIFMLAFSVCMGQEKQSYITYHQQCRKAEQQYLQDNVALCFQTYQQVFETYDILFPRDCFMAAQFAHHSNLDSLAIEFILKAIPFGLNPDFFTEDSTETNAPKLFQLKYSKHWFKIEQQKDSLHRIYMQKVDWELKNELMSMVRIDQDWRRKNNKWFNRKFRRGLEKKFDVINNQQVQFLATVFKEKGYPGYWLTGVGDSLWRQTNYGSFNNENLSELPNIILYHNDSVFLKYGDFLYHEIDKGHIHPRAYALIRDFSDRHLVKKDIHEKMYYNIWWERDNLTPEDIELHCHEIGCPTKQHLRNLSKKLKRGYDVFWSPFR